MHFLVWRVTDAHEVEVTVYRDDVFPVVSKHDLINRVWISHTEKIFIGAVNLMHLEGSVGPGSLYMFGIPVPTVQA
jgi:hypothetical protein